MSAYEFEFESIGGQSLPLERWRGQPILVVNTASECGFTPQYRDLQALQERYADDGLVVLGVPCNDFGGQEPGDEAAIQAFCQRDYGVTFPMTAKQSTIGGNAHPFYRWIGTQLGEDALPKWNFHKYLIDRQGELCGMWPSRVTPLSSEVGDAVEAALRTGE